MTWHILSIQQMSVVLLSLLLLLCKEEKRSAPTEAPWENQSHEAPPTHITDPPIILVDASLFSELNGLMWPF